MTSVISTCAPKAFFMIGDTLISTPAGAPHSPARPLQKAHYIPNPEYYATGYNQKLIIPRENFCIGWSGRQDTAVEFFEKINGSASELSKSTIDNFEKRIFEIWESLEDNLFSIVFQMDDGDRIWSNSFGNFRQHDPHTRSIGKGGEALSGLVEEALDSGGLRNRMSTMLPYLALPAMMTTIDKYNPVFNRKVSGGYFECVFLMAIGLFVRKII